MSNNPLRQSQGRIFLEFGSSRKTHKAMVQFPLWCVGVGASGFTEAAGKIFGARDLGKGKGKKKAFEPTYMGVVLRNCRMKLLICLVD